MEENNTGECFRIRIPFLQARLTTGDWGVPTPIFQFKDLTDDYRYQQWKMMVKGEIGTGWEKINY